MQPYMKLCSFFEFILTTFHKLFFYLLHFYCWYFIVVKLKMDRFYSENLIYSLMNPSFMGLLSLMTKLTLVLFLIYRYLKFLHLKYRHLKLSKIFIFQLKFLHPKDLSFLFCPWSSLMCPIHLLQGLIAKF